MSRYNVLLYDKDNDIYTTATSTDNLEIAYAVAKAFNKFVHRDMVINVGYDYREPYDAVYIEDAMYKENNLLYVNEGII
jgi:hypothetical protein